MNAIFGQCLRKSPSVALWQFYLTYIRRTNPIDRSSPERAALARDIITKAFEFSLAHVGTDIEAGSIWHDYIEFLKEGEVSACSCYCSRLAAACFGCASLIMYYTSAGCRYVGGAAKNGQAAADVPARGGYPAR